MRTNYVLVDYENVPVKSLSLLEEEHFRVRVFLGPKNTKLPVELVVAMQRLGKQAEYTILETSGTNALDFHIAYYLGILSTAEPTAYFHIISKDSGFDPLIQHLKTRGIYSSRSVSIEEMPCFAKKEIKEENSTALPCNTDQPDTYKQTPLPKRNPGIDVEHNFRLIHEDLIKRKSSKPRRVATLKSTMQARCGKDVAPAVVNAVFQQMVKKGFVKVDGEKVSYSLPEL